MCGDTDRCYDPVFEYGKFIQSDIKVAWHPGNDRESGYPEWESLLVKPVGLLISHTDMSRIEK